MDVISPLAKYRKIEQKERRDKTNFKWFHNKSKCKLFITNTNNVCDKRHLLQIHCDIKTTLLEIFVLRYAWEYY
jgi:hypothetical protein